MYFERLSWLLYLQSKYTSDKVKLASAIITHCWKTFFFYLKYSKFNIREKWSIKNKTHFLLVEELFHLFYRTLTVIVHKTVHTRGTKPQESKTRKLLMHKFIFFVKVVQISLWNQPLKQHTKLPTSFFLLTLDAKITLLEMFCFTTFLKVPKFCQ